MSAFPFQLHTTGYAGDKKLSELYLTEQKIVLCYAMAFFVPVKSKSDPQWPPKEPLQAMCGVYTSRYIIDDVMQNYLGIKPVGLSGHGYPISKRWSLMVTAFNSLNVKDHPYVTNLRKDGCVPMLDSDVDALSAAFEDFKKASKKFDHLRFYRGGFIPARLVAAFQGIDEVFSAMKKRAVEGEE